jgi:LmbE family N-acetylglucosaminyl deacetylase
MADCSLGRTTCTISETERLLGEPGLADARWAQEYHAAGRSVEVVATELLQQSRPSGQRPRRNHAAGRYATRHARSTELPVTDVRVKSAIRTATGRHESVMATDAAARRDPYFGHSRPTVRGASELKKNTMQHPIRQLRPATLPVTLLGVWAHPDDEAYLSSAMMSRVVTSGGRVVLATATRGERGGNDDPQRLSEVRERELRQAMSIIGVDDVRLLGYADGECAGADFDQAVGSIASLIDDVRPDLIVTFGPDGITHHPDHIAVSQWTTAAAAVLGHDGLLYATMTDEFARRHDDLHTQLGVWMAGEPCPVPFAELALHVVPTRRERALKQRVLRSHASQVSALVEMIGDEVFDSWWVEEFFRRPTTAELTSEQRMGAQSWLSI